MNRFPSKTQIAQIRLSYQPGTRIVLNQMEDPRGVPVGTRGEVQYAEGVVGRIARPGPQTAGEPTVFFDGIMLLDFLFISGNGGAVVIPVNELDIIGYQLLNFRGDLYMIGIVFATGGKAEKHISPHQQVKTIFLCDF